ncbi:MAG: hypothetical protein IJQ56_08665 [Synergistaceae bacterium]|nr:hypothetical protein [Synergistaceae bacterium]
MQKSENEHELDIPVSAELAKTIIENQTKEIELKKQEEDTKKQALKYNYDIARQSLQLQKEDRKEQREHQKIFWDRLMLFGGFIAVVLLVLVWIAMYFGKENFLLEIVKIIGYSGAGFWAGSSRQKRNSQPPDTTENEE